MEKHDCVHLYSNVTLSRYIYSTEIYPGHWGNAPGPESAVFKRSPTPAGCFRSKMNSRQGARSVCTVPHTVFLNSSSFLVYFLEAPSPGARGLSQLVVLTSWLGLVCVQSLPCFKVPRALTASLWEQLCQMTGR